MPASASAVHTSADFCNDHLSSETLCTSEERLEDHNNEVSCVTATGKNGLFKSILTWK